jgi:hypothetical protein
MPEAFGRALLDHHRGERDAPLYQRDGETVLEHPIEDFYFGDFGDQPDADWVADWLAGPLVDLGAGAGRDTLHFQSQFETVAIEVSDPLVTLLEERGVDDPRQGDMFALTEQFPADRFQSALAIGTQVGLAQSMAGLEAFLADLATVTTADATAVVDAYDPTFQGGDEMLGFRGDRTPGLAHRVLCYEYDGRFDPVLLCLLFSPDRLREAAADTAWHVAEIRRPHEAYYYRAALTKE